MNPLTKARILVVGDIMLDNYWFGETSRISPEAPVPVVHVQSQSAKAGGAANVALNITALGGEAHLLGLIGQDHNAQTLNSILAEHQVHSLALALPAHPTITKLRVLSQNQQLIRADFEEHFWTVDKTKLFTEFQTALTHCNVVIFSDYGKGTLSDIEAMIAEAKAQNKIILIDPKGTNFARYQGATYITPNLKELEAVTGGCTEDEDLVMKARQLIVTHALEGLLVTQGAQGMTLVSQNQEAMHIPTQAKEVFDVTGAGDTVIAVFGMGLSIGQDALTSMNLANAAAGIVVGKIGTSTVNYDELHLAIHANAALPTGIVDENTLAALVQSAKTKGETVVMTNGCFDILHPGHIDYLGEAKKLGDMLIVAVNSDASIKRLKGPNRPINSLEYRLKMLEALNMVDWVVAFDEDTPERLINTLLPSILVKGADYQINAIAGAKAVLDHGGQVMTLPLTEGHSTTEIINRIKAGE